MITTETRHIRKLLAASLLAACLPNATAQAYSGTQLQEWIASYERVERGNSSENDGLNAVALLGFVTGVKEGVSMSGLACAPSKATPRQFVAIVSKYMRSNPEKWTLWASVLVAAAIAEAFPCKGSANR